MTELIVATAHQTCKTTQSVWEQAELLCKDCGSVNEWQPVTSVWGSQQSSTTISLQLALSGSVGGTSRLSYLVETERKRMVGLGGFARPDPATREKGTLDLRIRKPLLFTSEPQARCNFLVVNTLAHVRFACAAVFRRFPWGWRPLYPAPVQRLEKDSPELPTFFQFPRSASGGWRKLRTIPLCGIVERGSVEAHRRTRRMVCFANVQRVDRMIFSIFNRHNEDWRNRALQIFTHPA